MIRFAPREVPGSLCVGSVGGANTGLPKPADAAIASRDWPRLRSVKAGSSCILNIFEVIHIHFDSVPYLLDMIYKIKNM